MEKQNVTDVIWCAKAENVNSQNSHLSVCEFNWNRKFSCTLIYCMSLIKASCKRSLQGLWIIHGSLSLLLLKVTQREKVKPKSSPVLGTMIHFLTCKQQQQQLFTPHCFPALELRPNRPVSAAKLCLGCQLQSFKEVCACLRVCVHVCVAQKAMKLA